MLSHDIISVPVAFLLSVISSLVSGAGISLNICLLAPCSGALGGHGREGRLEEGPEQHLSAQGTTEQHYLDGVIVRKCVYDQWHRTSEDDKNMVSYFFFLHTSITVGIKIEVMQDSSYVPVRIPRLIPSHSHYRIPMLKFPSSSLETDSDRIRLNLHIQKLRAGCVPSRAS